MSPNVASEVNTDPSHEGLNIVNPETDQDFFAIGRVLANRYSTCLKTQTSAIIIDKYKNIISWGVNMCCPQGQLYGLPVTECPRMDTKTGTSYALCMPIHAEIVACLNAFGVGTADRKNLWHFPGFTRRLKEYEGFLESRRAVLYLVGHYWACDECIEFLRSVGIEEIKFDNLSGADTQRKYLQQGLAQVTEAALDVSGSILEGIVTVEIAAEQVEAFCRQHNINRSRVKPFLDLINTFTIPVPKGKEQERAERFNEDSDVRSAKIVRLN